MTDANLEALESEAASVAAGHRPPLRQAIPIKWVENLQLAAVTPEAIRRRLQGHMVQAGAITGIVWHLIDFDASTALFEAACPYEFCEGHGTLMASTTIDKKGFAVLPFDSPGALCCDLCDLEIEACYEREAAKLVNPRKSSVKRGPSPLATVPGLCVDCGHELPGDAPAQKRRCDPCAVGRERERKRLSMAAKRAEVMS